MKTKITKFDAFNFSASQPQRATAALQSAQADMIRLQRDIDQGNVDTEQASEEYERICSKLATALGVVLP